MKIHDGLGLFPRKGTYLKYIFERGDPVKTNDLASRTVRSTIRRVTTRH